MDIGQYNKTKMKFIIKKLIDLIPEQIAEQCLRYRLGYPTISYSQNGEDILLWHIYRNKKKGFYVDVGAHHPRRFSNTHLLYKQGWSGINIDPISSMKDTFKERVRDVNINFGVSDQNGTEKYNVFSEGALNTCDEKITEKYPGKREVKEIQVFTLRDILEKYAPGKKIDLLSVDAEGSELKILNSNDWIKYSPEIIVIEDHALDINNPNKSKVDSFLKGKKYELFSKMNYTSFYRKI